MEKLELEPHFADYMAEANKPLGVYVSFWQPKLAAGTAQSYNVMTINDTDEWARGTLELSWQPEGDHTDGATAEKAFAVEPLGQMTYLVDLATPTVPGKYVLVAKAHWPGQSWSPVVARRKVEVYRQRAPE